MDRFIFATKTSPLDTHPTYRGQTSRPLSGFRYCQKLLHRDFQGYQSPCLVRSRSLAPTATVQSSPRSRGLSSPSPTPVPRTFLGFILDESCVWKASTIFFAVLFLLALFFPRHSIQTEDRGPCDCGDSIAEAKSMGCEYDTMAAAWLPPYCMDKALMAESDKDEDGPGGRWQY